MEGVAENTGMMINLILVSADSRSMPRPVSLQLRDTESMNSET